MARQKASGHIPNGGLLSHPAHRERNRGNLVGSFVSFGLVGFYGKEKYFKCLLVLQNAFPAVPAIFVKRSPLKSKNESARQEKQKDYVGQGFLCE